MTKGKLLARIDAEHSESYLKHAMTSHKRRRKKKEKKTKIALELSFNGLVTITVSTNRPCHSFLNFCHVTNYEKSVDSSEMSTFKLIQFPNLNVTC